MKEILLKFFYKILSRKIITYISFRKYLIKFLNSESYLCSSTNLNFTSLDIIKKLVRKHPKFKLNLNSINFYYNNLSFSLK